MSEWMRGMGWDGIVWAEMSYSIPKWIEGW